MPDGSVPNESAPNESAPNESVPGGSLPGRPKGDLSRFAGVTVPDLLPDLWPHVLPDLLPYPGLANGPLRLLFVGINPSLWTAATGAHFARPGNRFYPALSRAGLTDHVIDASAGYRPEDRAQLLKRGLGITNLVPRATARADELDAAEMVAGLERIARIVAEHRPAVVAFAGITAYRIAFAAPRARSGPQVQPLAGAQVFVVPNPSGLNAHEDVASLAAAYGAAARAAGISTAPAPGD